MIDTPLSAIVVATNASGGIENKAADYTPPYTASSQGSPSLGLHTCNM